MKKFLLFAFALVASLSTWAQNPVEVTSASQLSKGTMVYFEVAEAAGNYLNGTATCATTVSSETVFELVEGTANNTFLLKRKSDGTYLKGNGEVATAGDTQSTIELVSSATEATDFTFAKNTRPGWLLGFAVNGETYAHGALNSYNIMRNGQGTVVSYNKPDNWKLRNWKIYIYTEPEPTTFEGVVTASKTTFSKLSDLDGLQLTFEGATTIAKGGEDAWGLILTNEAVDEIYATWTPSVNECTIEGNVVTLDGFVAGGEYELPSENCTLYIVDNGSFVVDGDEEATINNIALTYVAPKTDPTGETVPTYTIKSPRGDLFTDGNGYLLSTRSLTLAGSRTATNDKWVIVPAKDNEHGVYIYNVEHKTFIGSNNKNAGNEYKAPMVAEPNMFYRWATGSTNETVKNNAYNDLQYKETDYPYCLAEEDGMIGKNYYSINVCNWDDKDGNHTGLRLCGTDHYDDGNIFAITESGTMPKEDYDALLDLIFPTTPATPEAIAEAEALLALTGVGYPAETAEARTALAALVAQEKVAAIDLAAAVSAYKACTEITMPTAAKKYTVTAHFIDGTEAKLAVVDGKLTLTRTEGAEAEVEAVSVEGSNVVLKTGEAYIHWTSGDATSKSADLDGLNEELDEALNTLTLQAGGAEHFGQVLIQGAGTDGNRYYYIVRDNLDGTFAWVAQYPSDKFFDTNWNSNGQNRTSYFTFTEIEEQPTGDEFTFVGNNNGTVTITPAKTTNYWYLNVVAQSVIEDYGENESEQTVNAVYEAVGEFTSLNEGYQGAQTINVPELYKQLKGADITEGSYVITVAYITEEEIVEGVSMVVPDFDSPNARFDYTQGSTTGIQATTTSAQNGACFDLAGRRINANVKGISILNGKKVIR